MMQLPPQPPRGCPDYCCVHARHPSIHAHPHGRHVASPHTASACASCWSASAASLLATAHAGLTCGCSASCIPPPPACAIPLSGERPSRTACLVRRRKRAKHVRRPESAAGRPWAFPIAHSTASRWPCDPDRRRRAHASALPRDQPGGHHRAPQPPHALLPSVIAGTYGRPPDTCALSCRRQLGHALLRLPMHSPWRASVPPRGQRAGAFPPPPQPTRQDHVRSTTCADCGRGSPALSDEAAVPST